MSIELANEKWLDGNKRGLLGQFASTRGYSDLIAAVEAKAADYPALDLFFERGATDQVDQVRKELAKLAAETDGDDVASTARALSRLAKGQELIIITNGAS
jgi:hypothetical protein